jgi:hypothetical protein
LCFFACVFHKYDLYWYYFIVKEGGLNMENPNQFNLQAREQIEHIKQEIKAIEEEIKPKLEQLDQNKKRLEYLSNYLEMSQEGVKLSAGPIGVYRRRRGSLTTADYAVRVLKRIGQPLHYQEIMERVQNEEGFEIPGKDPKANMTAHLSNDERITRVERGVYGLVEWTENDEGSESLDSEPSV